MDVDITDKTIDEHSEKHLKLAKEGAEEAVILKTNLHYKNYIDYLDADVLAATGTSDDVKQLAKLVKMQYSNLLVTNCDTIKNFDPLLKPLEATGVKVWFQFPTWSKVPATVEGRAGWDIEIAAADWDATNKKLALTGGDRWLAATLDEALLHTLTSVFSGPWEETKTELKNVFEGPELKTVVLNILDKRVTHLTQTMVGCDQWKTHKKVINSTLKTKTGIILNVGTFNCLELLVKETSGNTACKHVRDG